MEFVIFFLFAVAALFLIVGVVKLFLPGRRAKGWAYIVAALIAFGSSVFLNSQRMDEKAKVAGFANHEAMKSAEKAQREKLNRAVATAELNRRAKAKAEQKIQKKARRARLAAKTKEMTQSVVTVMKEDFETVPQPLLPDGDLCWENGYCTFTIWDFSVNISGAGIARVEINTQKSHANYREVCAIVFSAIANVGTELAREIIGQSFHDAVSRSVERDMMGVKVSIGPELSAPLLSCRFFMYD